jgi:ATP-binding cassette subfamily F protein uup
MYTIRKASIAFGGPPLLDDAQLTIQKYERVALIGRNGQGKSTLMKIIAGLIRADTAEIEKAPSLTVAYLQQEVPLDLTGRVRDVILQGVEGLANLENRYQQASHALESANDTDAASLLEQMSHLHSEMESKGSWDLSRKTDRLLETLKIDGELHFESLSGGLKRRVILGRELIKEPDLILLDEPTNHLDFEAIQWLESFLTSLKTALLFVTHDRVFLEKVATRIVELDRSRLTAFDCDYRTYLSRKAELLEAESSANAVFDKKLAQEEVWIRQGIKARRTRNEGRVRSLEKMRQVRSERRNLTDAPQFGIENAQLSGRKVIEVEHLCYSWDHIKIVEDFSTTIWRGDKIGLIGPNGSGKTTFLQLLLGELTPDSGSVRHGTQLQCQYFDQYRAQLDPDATLRAVVAGDEEFVAIGDQKRHIYSYLSDFLFSSEQARGRVSALSGGEKNRLLLARLFAKTSNLLIMDEPTNDLDLETLELLEERLFDYQGTLLLVSHDRKFLNRVVTQTIAFEGEGTLRETVGGYDDYMRERALRTRSQSPLPVEAKKAKPTASPDKPRFRTNREHWELESIPDQIAELERVCEQNAMLLSDAKVVSDPTKLAEIQTVISSAEEEIDRLMRRWESIEMTPVNPNKPIPPNPNK